MPEIMTASTDQSHLNIQFKKARTFSHYPGIIQDASDPGQYRMDADGRTELPLSSEFGGVEGADDPRGLIIPGDKMKLEGKNWVSLGTNTVLPLDVIRGRAKQQSTASAPPPPPATPAGKRSKKRAEQNHNELEQILQTSAPEVPFSMSGSFGSFDGVCRHIVENDKLIVVIRSSTQAGYTPPVNSDLFTITAFGKSWEVCNFGLSFRYEAFQGVQLVYTIFVRKVQ